MSYRITGLSPEPFRHLYGLSDAELAARGAKRCIADAKPGYPDRIELRDAEPGESLILVNYVHQPTDGPYRASHAVYVLEGADATYDRNDEVPEVLRVRGISLRGFDASHLMIDADLVDGYDLEPAIERMLADGRAAYVQAHYAKAGCYAAHIERA